MAKQMKRKKRRHQVPVNRFCRFTKAGVTEVDYKAVSYTHLTLPTKRIV